MRIIALVKPFRVQAVLDGIEAEGVALLGGTAREAMGHGRQKDRLRHYLKGDYGSTFVPKVELTLFVAEEQVAAAVRAVVAGARTGRIGDGKILVLPCLGEIVGW